MLEMLFLHKRFDPWFANLLAGGVFSQYVIRIIEIDETHLRTNFVPHA
jgi:hypothetical protein